MLEYWLWLTGRRGVGLRGLRALLERECKRRRLRLFVPPLELCGDNGAMIGSQAYYEAMAGHFADLSLNAMPTMPIDEEF